ncbi:MAG: Dam family site-specific DNA-(adenine-N6)-methyltransferase [SAR324 cluster bacterium]|nr:Dam family site-specific DNA-(adenine-N6)-methyltransferase [SAR324 cluster bacterium]
MVDISKPITPFLKWAGGKRWLIANHSKFFPAQKNYDRYIEPFLGSGAVFFHLAPSSSIISDTNSELLRTYHIIRKYPIPLFERLLAHQHSHCLEHYYTTRRNVPSDPLELAARFIYLNRTCWNGLYRVNHKGEFNVPKGSKSTVIFPNDDFGLLSAVLHTAFIVASDFEKIIDHSKSGDFIYVDPPYTVAHDRNGFLKYNERIFSWNDQIRLRDSLFRAKNRGANVLLSNANHESIRNLYLGFGKSLVLDRFSILAAKSRYRRYCQEILIQSWS